MARPTILVCAVACGFGCSGTIDEGDQVANLTPAQQLAQNAWLQLAYPAFQTDTCVMCHDPDDPSYNGTMAAGAPPYLAGSSQLDQRDTVIATMPAVVSLTSPRASLVLTKGPHEGPALDAPSATNILTWITYERSARLGSAMLPTTMPYTLMLCMGGSAGGPTCPINSIDLTPLGAAGTVTFTATPVADDTGANNDIDVEQLTITAGASGLHVVHPDFGTVGSGSAQYDPQDRFFNVDMELDPSATLSLGETVFAEFLPTDPIVVQFDTLTAKQ